jgi:DNA polymerase I-like protein with 3'-5' exonuclease and polymerase domains
MVAEFILSGQTRSFVSLNDLCALYELGQKEDVVKQYWDKGISTEDIPRDIVESYGNHDVDLTYQVYLHQLVDPRMTPELHAFILLAGEDLKGLQEMEYIGFKYNKEKSLALAKEHRAMIDQIESELQGYENNREINFNSPDQLSAYLYGGTVTKTLTRTVTSIIQSGPNKGKERTIQKVIGEETTIFNGFFDPIPGTELKKENLYSTSEDVLKKLKAPTKLQRLIISSLLKWAELEKLCGTYYEGLPKRMDTMNWIDTIHGEYNQVVVRTGRLSSSKPNMQNNPPEADALFESRYC